MDINELTQRVRNWLETEYRKDELYRYPILQSQLGDIAKYIYHDQKYNPEVRVFGTKNDEIILYGEVLCHLIALMISREINITEAFDKGIRKLEEKDGYKKEGRYIILDRKETLEGIPASPGKIEGIAFVVPNTKDLDSFSGVPKNSILITQHLTPDAAINVRILRFKGIVTDSGSSTCHGAIIANELKIPCVCGTGSATKVIKTGDFIVLNGEKGTVSILRDKK